MFTQRERPIVLSIGGSLIVPNGGPDAKFLRELNVFIREHVKQGKRFFLVAGGGKTARHYVESGEAIGDITNEDLDWLGIHATRLNAHLLRTIFQDIAHPRIIENYDKRLLNWSEPVVVGAGWKPGWSTDYDAVLLARDYGAQLIVNMSNIEWVYDKDPRQYKDAKIIKKMTWEEMEKLVGTEWKPGMNAPFDPIAAQLAKQLGLTVIVTNGLDFNNLDKIIKGDTFKGTVIMPYHVDADFYDKEYYTGKKGAYRVAKKGSLIGNVVHSITDWYRAFIIKIFLNPKTCLDLGCGTGSLVAQLRKFGIDAYGVDISKEAIELADPQVKPYLKQGDVAKLPFEDNEFDAVVSFDVLEHLERGKIQKAVGESVRVAKKFILHKIYTQENVWINVFHSRDFSHQSVFSKRYWQKLFSELPEVSVLRSGIFRLPSFIESLYLLKKNT